MGDEFHSSGGEQNIAQGNYAIGKQVNVTQSVHGNGNIFSGTGNVTVNGIPPELFAQYVRDLGVTDSALASFFKILEEQQIPRGDLDSKLREIAFRYKELLLRFEAIISDDPQVQALKKQAKQAIENGDYDRAEKLLNQAKERDRAAVATLKASLAEQQAALEKRQLSEAQSCVDQADLQRLQYRYAKSAEYFQEAAAALPEGYEWERADYLGAAGYDLLLIARYAESLHLFEQSLFIFRAIGDQKEEGRLLNNISGIYWARGDYGKTLDCLEQSLTINQYIGNKEGEGVMLNNIAVIYKIKGDYQNALDCFKQSLLLRGAIHDKKGESVTLNNIGLIYYEQGDYEISIEYYNQALAISHEINDKATASKALNNISTVYYAQKNYDAALETLKQSLDIAQHIGDRRVEVTTLNNIAMIYKDKGYYAAALKQYEQVLAIAKEIGAKAEEVTIIRNIGVLYKDQDDLFQAEPYLSRAVELGTQLERPDLKEWRNGLEIVRAKLRGQKTANAASTVKLP